MEERDLQKLLSEMSLDEKIDQMLQLNGQFYSEDSEVVTGPMKQFGINEKQINQAGSVLNVTGARNVKRIQDNYMKKNPHKIPLMFMADIINGYRTIFPMPLAQGCTFDTDLAKEIAAVSAREAARAGIHVTFSPMVDLVRDARWGRVMESTGEDTYLNCCFAQAMVEGYQGEDVGSKDTLAACVKHFAAYGLPTAGREYNNVELSERTLRDNYLPAYEAAVKAGCEMAMTSFNTINLIPVTGHSYLTRDILRGEMGFEGVLISDWVSIAEMVNHGYAHDKKDAAYKAIVAGVDIDMMTDCYTNNLKKLVEEGQISEELIDEAVMRILKLKNKLGLFENPYKGADEIEDERAEIPEEHRKLARRAAAESFVLLKNDGLLPLSKDSLEKGHRKIAFIGPYIFEKNMNSTWSFFVNTEDNVTIEEALKANGYNHNISLAKGSTILSPGDYVPGFAYNSYCDATEDELNQMRLEAVRKAKEADLVVMALGEHREQSGEGASRADITIPKVQMELFNAVYEVNKNIAVILFSGRPLDIRDINDKARAILEVWMPGTEGGNAIVDVIFGHTPPGGRLAMSFPYSVGQVPIFYNEFNTGRRLTQDNERTRCISKYLDIPNTPLYPFGYGLTYTDFQYSNITLSSNVLKSDTAIEARVAVTNIGNLAAKEVVQMYIQDLVGSVVRPIRELKGFKKILLQPGETQVVSFEINCEMLKFTDINMNFVAEHGQFKVYIGQDSTTENEAEFEFIK